MKIIETTLFLIFLLFGTSVFSQIELNANIKKVTVFSLGAEVTHVQSVKLTSGQNTLILKDVSPHISEGTIQIPDEEITVINSSLIKKLSNAAVLELKDEIDSYRKQIGALDKGMENISTSFPPSDFGSFLSLYDTRIRALKKSLRLAEESLKKDEAHSGVTYLEILVSTQQSVTKKIELKYVVGSAAWVPKYEIFVPSISENLKLKYIAKIMNKTGEDWNDVELTLSLNSPFDKAGKIPSMDPIFYSYSGSSQKKTINGRDSRALEQLKIEGVEYIEYDAPPYTELITVEGRKTIPANGGIYSYDVFTKSMATSYTWYAYPGKEEHPFLIGRIAGWDSLPLIDGEVKVFLNGTNIGDSYISLEGLPDTLDIPIGQNQEILVERVIIGNENFRKESGNKVKTTYSYGYKIKSNTTQKINLKVFDQIPISQSNHIDVTMIDHSTGKYNDESGLVTWNFVLEPKEEIKNTKLSYSVEYNKSKVSSSFYRQSYSSMGKRGSVRKVRAKF